MSALAPDPRIEALLAAARGQVTQQNARRNQLALLAALGLTDSGLLERSNAVARAGVGAGFTEAPDLQNIGYDIQQGPRGRAFRQGFLGIEGAAAQRGAGFSSATRNSKYQLDKDLSNQINMGLRNFDQSQNQTFMDETAQLGELGSKIADIRFELGREDAARREAAQSGGGPVGQAITAATGPRAQPVAMGRIRVAGGADPLPVSKKPTKTKYLKMVK